MRKLNKILGNFTKVANELKALEESNQAAATKRRAAAEKALREALELEDEGVAAAKARANIEKLLGAGE